MNLIVAVDENWGIGNEGKLLYSISEDMKNFRELTTGKTVILGRKTLSTFPGGKPLKNRKNIVLSSDKGYYVEGATVCHSLEEALKEAENDETWVIGGESVYRLFLPYCDNAVVTKIYDGKMKSDKFFPNLDEMPEWKTAETSEVKSDEKSGIKFAFVTYKKVL